VTDGQTHEYFSAINSQYFIAGMMSDSTNPVQQSTAVLEVWPFRSGWQCFEAPGGQPDWTGENSKQSVLDYARARVKFGRGEIRVLNPDRSVERTIPFDESGS
jgi:hypothetical protein